MATEGPETEAAPTEEEESAPGGVGWLAGSPGCSLVDPFAAFWLFLSWARALGKCEMRNKITRQKTKQIAKARPDTECMFPRVPRTILVTACSIV